MKTVLEMNHKYIQKLIDYYKAYQVKPSTEHIKYMFQTDDFTISVYHSNKVLFQGEQAIEEYRQWAKVIGVEPIIPEPVKQTAYMNEYYNDTVIGSDEVGTGDFFGPIVVTAALVGKKNYPFLKSYNIQDSKKLKDELIVRIAPELIKEIPHHTLILHNEKYNDLIKEGYNMNKIKAYLHNHAIKKMINKGITYDTIIIDQFCSKENYYKYLSHQSIVKDIVLLEKAESLHLSVAVAAIIARYEFIKAFDQLSDTYNMTLPKGASASVDAIAKLLHLKHGDDIFYKVAKLNFKNYQKIRD
mgnify:CR=1 FL=1